MGETIIRGLKPDTEYVFQIVPANSNNIAGTPSVEVGYHTEQDTYAPPAPTILDTGAVGRLLHVVVAHVVAADFAGFEFHASTEEGFTPSASTLIQSGDSTTCEFMGTDDAQTWYLRVRSYDTSGNTSDYTAEGSAATAAFNPDDTTAPAAPADLELSTGVETNADGTSIVYIDAAWTANTETDLAGYEVRCRKGSDPYAYLPAPEAALRISGLVGNADYDVSVRALDRNHNASAWTAAEEITTAKDTTGPAAPTSFSASAYLGTIVLTWENPADLDFSHVNLYGGATSTREDAELIARVKGTSFVDYPGGYGETRYYWIAAADTSGNLSDPEAGPANATTAAAAAGDLAPFAVTAAKIWTRIPILSGEAWTDDSPASGSIAWNAHKLYYDGVEYSIAAGNTDHTYVYWPSGGTAYSATDVNPTLTDGDFLIATNVGGVHDLAWNAIANQVVGTAHIQDLAVTNAKVNDLAVDKLTAGTITSQSLTLAVADGSGDAKIQAGKTDFGDTTAGFILGIDDSETGNPVIFAVGDDTYWFTWDGKNLSWKGTNAELTAAGVLSAGNVLITGGSVGGFGCGAEDGFWAGEGATRVQMQPGVGIWAGATDIDDAPFAVSNAGEISAVSGTIGGCLLAENAIGSDAYVSGPLGSGWNIGADGSAEFQDAVIRGVIRTSVFEKDTLSSVNGLFVVSPSDVLAADMTSLDAATLTISGATAFVDHEVLRICDGTSEEWMIVTSAAAAPTYTVTRDLPGVFASDDNPAWKKGTAVVSMGVGTGTKTGFIVMDASSPNSPYVDVCGRNSDTYRDYTLHARLGWLKGITDADVGLSGTDVWGLYTDNAYLKGVIVANTGKIGGTSGWTIGAKTLTGAADSKIVSGLLESSDWGSSAGSQIDLVNKTIKFGGSNAPKFSVAADGVVTAVGATITGDFKTSATVGTTKGVHLDVTNNELYFYGDRGDSTIEMLASIGIKSYGSDYIIGQFGSENSSRIGLIGWADDKVGIYGISNSWEGLYGISDSWDAVTGQSNSGAGINGISLTGYGGYFYTADSATYALYAAGKTYIIGNCSAESFTDRTPHYEGDALAELRKVRGKDGQIDHDTLPEFTRCMTTISQPIIDGKSGKISKDKRGRPRFQDVSAPGRDLGATISMLVVAVQQLADQVAHLENKSN